jgi:hypothetical protein
MSHVSLGVWSAISCILNPAHPYLVVIVAPDTPGQAIKVSACVNVTEGAKEMIPKKGRGMWGEMEERAVCLGSCVISIVIWQ